VDVAAEPAAAAPPVEGPQALEVGEGVAAPPPGALGVEMFMGTDVLIGEDGTGVWRGPFGGTIPPLLSPIEALSSLQGGPPEGHGSSLLGLP